MTSTLGITIAAMLAGVISVVVLLALSRDRLGGSAVIRSLGALAVAGAVVFVPVRGAGVEMFGTVHLAYLGATLAVPMLGLAVIARSLRRPRPRSVVVVGAVLVVPGLLGFYATHIEPYRLRVTSVSVLVDRSRQGNDPIRIAVFADIQMDRVTGFERRAVDRLLATRPDVILVPGDLFQSDPGTFARWLPKLQALLRRLRAPGGVFVVRGDVDVANRSDLAFAKNTDARILDDEVVTVRVRDRRLRIGGTRLGYDSAAASQVRRDLVAGPEDGTFRILLSHRPDTVFGLEPSSRVDLTVAGHTHGGQVVLPGYGPLMTMTSVPRDVARGGLHEIAGNRIYVSSGIGMERLQAPQVRFNDPPTIDVLELHD